jgi:hypothetical protein
MSWLAQNQFQNINRGRTVDTVSVPDNWSLLGWSISPIAGAHEYDADVVGAIRRDLWPDFIPLTYKTVYKAPSGEHRVFEHHGFGHIVTDPLVQFRRVKMLWPTTGINAKFASYAGQLMVDGPLGFVGDSENMPGPTKPIGWNLYRQLQHEAWLVKQLSREQEADGLERSDEDKYERNNAAGEDAYMQRLKSREYRIRGNPRVSVPTSYVA